VTAHKEILDVPKKAAKCLMHQNFATTSHWVMWFHQNVQKLSARKTVSLLQLNILHLAAGKRTTSKTSILANFSRQMMTKIEFTTNQTPQNSYKRCTNMWPPPFCPKIVLSATHATENISIKFEVFMQWWKCRTRKSLSPF